MIEELQKLAGAETEIVIPVPPMDKETTEMPEGDDDVLKAIKNKWVAPFQLMNLLRHNLDKYAADNSDGAISLPQTHCC